MLKKSFLLTLVCIILFTTPLAAQEMIIQGYSDVFMSYEASIGVYGSRIICEAGSDLAGYYDTSIKMQLQKYVNGSWVTLQSWYRETHHCTITIVGGYDKAPGVYRTIATHKAGGETQYSYSPNFLVN
ncbi:MAG: hypothetical protein ACOX2X_04855 [Peptococcia bacterium]|jgi:hypothetical protein